MMLSYRAAIEWRMRKFPCAFRLLAIATLFAAVAAAPADYPPLRIRFDSGGELTFQGWNRVGEHQWLAPPGDAAAPRYLGVDHGPAVVDPGAEFRRAAGRLGIAAPREVATRRIETWNAMPGRSGKAWATAGAATVGGIPQSLFALTSFDAKRKIYTTHFFMIPTASYRRWGGVMTFLDNFGISPHVQGLPQGFAEKARNATPAEQAQIFAGILDVAVLRLATDAMQARNSLLQTLQGVGRDIDTRTDCQMTPNCEFVPGALPGQGKTSINRR
jgi:hypothetical protein